jgi:hypothetical protein
VRDDDVLEYGGVRIDLSHVTETSGLPILSKAQARIDAGQRPPLLTVRNGGVDVSSRPDLWPDAERKYRGPGRVGG